MDKVLFVVDMQEMYVGRGREKEAYPYKAEELIDNINSRIAAYKPDEVFYIISIKKGLLGGMGCPKAGSHGAKFVERLKIVSKNIYEKSKPDAFSNDSLVDFMRARSVKEIEFIGIDGGTSIGLSAISAIDICNLRVIFNEKCIGSLSKDKVMKCREKMKKSRVTYIQE